MIFPKALMRDDTKLQKSQITSKPIIYIFNSIGDEISAIRVSILLSKLTLVPPPPPQPSVP